MASLVGHFQKICLCCLEGTDLLQQDKFSNLSHEVGRQYVSKMFSTQINLSDKFTFLITPNCGEGRQYTETPYRVQRGAILWRTTPLTYQGYPGVMNANLPNKTLKKVIRF